MSNVNRGRHFLLVFVDIGYEQVGSNWFSGKEPFRREMVKIAQLWQQILKKEGMAGSTMYVCGKYPANERQQKC